MDLERELRETYAERLGGLDLPGGDVAAARRTGARMRTRRRLAVGVAAVAVVAVAVGGSLAGSGRLPVGPSHSQGDWRELPTPPLSPRANAESVWTGHEVIVLGGETNPCPPNADCAVGPSELRDGAAYDPAENTWRRIASAPVPVGPGDRLLAAGGQVVLRHWRQNGSDWFVYDPDADDWSRISGVPSGIGDLPSALGPDVYAMAGRRVAAYSVVRDDWTLLPPDPIEPALSERRVTATDVGPVVTGMDSTQPQDGSGSEPLLILADVWDGRQWRRLPPSEQLANNAWTWTGARMVDPEPFTLNGGDVNGWGRSYPMGGTLDPATGTWGPLPDDLVDPPHNQPGWNGPSASLGPWIAVLGQVYDDSSGRIYRPPVPDGAPDYGSAAAFAGDQLLVFGGATFGSSGSTISNRAWIWTP